MFNRGHCQRYNRISDATAGAGANNGYWKITEVWSPSEVSIAGAHVAESTLHWKMVGGYEAVGILEQPLQIIVT
jgi:hypothetical protein